MNEIHQRTVTITRDGAAPEVFHIDTAEDMMDLGVSIAAQCRGGEVIALEGDLGAGKTTLTKGIAVGLGITEDVTSPTFVIMDVYPAPKQKKGPALSLCHIDAYRLHSWSDVVAIGGDEYMGDPKTVTVIEWPELIAPIPVTVDMCLHLS